MSWLYYESVLFPESTILKIRRNPSLYPIQHMCTEKRGFGAVSFPLELFDIPKMIYISPSYIDHFNKFNEIVVDNSLKTFDGLSSSSGCKMHQKVNMCLHNQLKIYFGAKNNAFALGINSTLPGVLYCMHIPLKMHWFVILALIPFHTAV